MTLFKTDKKTVTTLEKLEYVHCSLQVALSEVKCSESAEMMGNSIEIIEDLREPYLQEDVWHTDGRVPYQIGEIKE